MSNHITDCCGQIKAIAEATEGTPTQKLLAILAFVGVEKTADLMRITGLKERAIQTAKRTVLRPAAECATPQYTAVDPQQNAPTPQPIAVDPAVHCATPHSVAGRARVEDNNLLSYQEPTVEIINTPLPPKRAKRTKADGPTKVQALEAFNAYNDTALRCGLPQASKFTPQRERAITARLKTHGLDGWTTALANIEKSAFLRGKTDHQFRADLDFVCQAKSFDRLHDGGYGNGAVTKPQATGYRPQPPPLIPFNDTIVQTPDLEAFARSCLVE